MPVRTSTKTSNPFQADMNELTEYAAEAMASPAYASIQSAAAPAHFRARILRMIPNAAMLRSVNNASARTKRTPLAAPTPSCVAPIVELPRNGTVIAMTRTAEDLMRDRAEAHHCRTG